MSCSRGAASPDAHTKLRLFADSAGYCQKPTCLARLFVDAGGTPFHIAEMAHIIAASDDGPRANAATTAAERGLYDNLILLCPTCHVVIDKAPDDYPDTTIRRWKAGHVARIAEAFGVRKYEHRHAARLSIEPLVSENWAIFDQYGPHNEYRANPESEMAELWQRKVLSKILPNNRMLLRILDANRARLVHHEKMVLERFRQHVDDLEARHLGAGLIAAGATFPEEMTSMLAEIAPVRSE